MIIMIIISKVILINLSVMWIASIAAPGLAKTRELGQYSFYIIIHDHLGWFLGNLGSCRGSHSQLCGHKWVFPFRHSGVLITRMVVRVMMLPLVVIMRTLLGTFVS